MTDIQLNHFLLSIPLSSILSITDLAIALNITSPLSLSNKFLQLYLYELHGDKYIRTINEAVHLWPTLPPGNIVLSGRGPRVLALVLRCVQVVIPVQLVELGPDRRDQLVLVPASARTG